MVGGPPARVAELHRPRPWSAGQHLGRSGRVYPSLVTERPEAPTPAEDTSAQDNDAYEPHELEEFRNAAKRATHSDDSDDE